MTGRTAATPAAKSVELDSVFDELKALLARYASSFTVSVRGNTRLTD
jgi:hypothetical protein